MSGAPVSEATVREPVPSQLSMESSNYPLLDEIEKLTSRTDFWKGLLLGTMAGAVFATYTFALTDFLPKSQLKKSPIPVAGVQKKQGVA